MEGRLFLVYHCHHPVRPLLPRCGGVLDTTRAVHLFTAHVYHLVFARSCLKLKP